MDRLGIKAYAPSSSVDLYRRVIVVYIEAAYVTIQGLSAGD